MPSPNAIPRRPLPDARPGPWQRLKNKLGRVNDVQPVAYRSFGTPTVLRVQGRVLEGHRLDDVGPEGSTVQHVLDIIHRLESDEIPGASLRAHFGGKTWETKSDNEGFFVFTLELDEPVASGWHEVEIELVEALGEIGTRRVQAPVLVPSEKAQFAVVSDVDDTIIESHATNKLAQAALLFSTPADERMPFKGVPAFYQALCTGPDGEGDNPIFYVSRSGWNLYDLFETFFEEKGVPLGPMFLRDMRTFEKKSAVLGSDEHKFERIDLLLRTYSDLPFVLIGDSGQHDAHLYEKIVHAHPGRIKAVYLHDVKQDDGSLDEYEERLAEAGVPVVHADTTYPVAKHAADLGLISQHDLTTIKKEDRE